MATNTTGTNFFTKYTSTVDVGLTNTAGQAMMIVCAAGDLPTTAGFAIGCIALASDSGVLYYNTGTALVASFTAVNAGAAAFTMATALTDTSSPATTGSMLSLTATALTSGVGLNVINGNTTNFTTGAILIKSNIGTAIAGAGLSIVGSGAYRGTGMALITNAALDQGKGLVITLAGLTTGYGISLLSGDAMTTGGNLVYLDMHASTTGNALTAITTGAYDGTGLIQVTANAATTGQVVSILSSSTAFATTGRLFYSYHSGNAGTSAVINEFKSAAGDETVILKVTASAANALGTAFAISSATTTGYAQTITANSLTSGSALLVTSSSASTSGSASVEPVLFTTTLTGAGAVGGRVRAFMTANVALGGWSNALKGEVTYGATGSTAGLGSAVCAEMTLSAGTTVGTYGVLELELNLASGAKTGTATSLIYASVNGTDAGTFSTNGYFMTLAGLTAGATKILTTGITAATINTATTASLKVLIGATTYYIPLATAIA